ncbi:hypothetical protein [Nocardia acidivorans]|uniref:hypothetical protein n=1 Tax=Nocardia acidivorans TaxID=404580 RepID=UPI0012FB5F09|nr:hypothetical protein [Nocardia acidivorans]
MNAAPQATAIITEAVQPAGRIKLGAMPAEFWRENPLTDEEHAALNNRDRTQPNQ